MATVTFEKAFTLTRDDGRPIEFLAGEQNVPDELVQHWFVQLHIAPVSVQDSGAVELSDKQNFAPDSDQRKPGRQKKI